MIATLELLSGDNQESWVEVQRGPVKKATVEDEQRQKFPSGLTASPAPTLLTLHLACCQSLRTRFLCRNLNEFSSRP